MPDHRVEPCSRNILVQAADALLQPDRFKDYGPNGLQVEGKAVVRRLVSGVTASLALIEAAIEQQADAILVHHGLFWRGQDGRVVGWMKQRLSKLLSHDINLLAYHLPLDAHPVLGNNAQLAQRLGLTVQGTFGEQELGLWGESPSTDPGEWVARVELVLGRTPLMIQADPSRPWRRIGWCSGGAQGYFEAAIEAGVDVFLTGEISEPQAHLARETGVSFLACGHHATERWGASAVAAHLAQQLGLEHFFIDIPNPA
jgi:dinuclear metal center YbgI/SA1388 family protein